MINFKNARKRQLNPLGNDQQLGLRPKVPVCFLLLIAAILAVRIVLAQSIPQPVLTITSVATNQLVITITNGLSTAIYDLYTTPILGDPANFPWTAAVIGTNSQTNFVVPIGPYFAGFYRAVVETNIVPIWEAADPNNPGAGILAVFIDSPTNGAVLQ